MYAINGINDHIHILCSFPTKISLAVALRNIKGSSSTWLHKKYPKLSYFKWQAGYGAFSVSHSQVDEVKVYVENQLEHHKEMTFQEDFLILLKKHKVDFNEDYLWG